MIKQNTLQLLTLVNQILDLRKLESQQMEINLVQGDVVRYLRYIVESLESYATGQGIQMHFLTNQQVIAMDYDADKLLRIVSYLLSNAIKFTPKDGHIYFQLDQKGTVEESLLQIRIEDTGSGIPEDQLPRIFERFYQVDDSSTRREGGTGIGLALTKQMVTLLGGEK